MKDRLITIKSTTYSKAEIIKNKLELEGIECYIKNSTLIRPFVPGGIDIKINEADIEKALRIINMLELEQRLESEKSINIHKVERILVPVDFTEKSVQACLYAINIAIKFKANVKLVHIFPSPILDIIPVTESHTIQVNVDIMIREMETNVKKDMEAFIRKLKGKLDNELENINLKYELFSGDTAIDILEYADSYNPDMIILGTSSQSEAKSKNLSRLISYIVQHAKTPVLILPEDTAYNNIHELHNIMYATDFDETDFNAIRKLMKIINPFNLKIFCVHISKQEQSAWDQVKIESLAKYFDSVYKKSNVECVNIVGSNIIERLNEFAEKNSIGIICLTTHKRNILTRLLNPSTTKMMLHNTNIPLLAFHSL